MLVAMANSNCVRNFLGLKCCSSSEPKLSHTILPPMNPNIVKAIQWSYASIYAWKWLMPNHPISGIIA